MHLVLNRSQSRTNYEPNRVHGMVYGNLETKAVQGLT
jgi:hypothetical protein